jgi:hypothetical protein
MPCVVDDTYMPKDPQPTMAEFNALKAEADAATKLLCQIGKEVKEAKGVSYPDGQSYAEDDFEEKLADYFPTLHSKSFRAWIKKHCAEDEKRAKKEKILKDIAKLQKELDGL